MYVLHLTSAIVICRVNTQLTINPLLYTSHRSLVTHQLLDISPTTTLCVVNLTFA